MSEKEIRKKAEDIAHRLTFGRDGDPCWGCSELTFNKSGFCDSCLDKSGKCGFCEKTFTDIEVHFQSVHDTQELTEKEIEQMEIAQDEYELHKMKEEKS